MARPNLERVCDDLRVWVAWKMNALVRPSDAESPVFVFIGVGEEEVTRLRSLVDPSHSV